MKVYICYRYNATISSIDSWKGALLIAARSEAEASMIYQRNWYDGEPEYIAVLEGVTATGEPRIIYDDEAR